MASWPSSHRKKKKSYKRVCSHSWGCSKWNVHPYILLPSQEGRDWGGGALIPHLISRYVVTNPLINPSAVLALCQNRRGCLKSEESTENILILKSRSIWGCSQDRSNSTTITTGRSVVVVHTQEREAGGAHTHLESVGGAGEAEAEASGGGGGEEPEGAGEQRQHRDPQPRRPAPPPQQQRLGVAAPAHWGGVARRGDQIWGGNRGRRRRGGQWSGLRASACACGGGWVKAEEGARCFACFCFVLVRSLMCGFRFGRPRSIIVI